MKSCQNNTAQPPHTAQPAFPFHDLFPKRGCPKGTELVPSLLNARALLWCGGQLVFDVAKPLSWAMRRDQQLQFSFFTQYKPIHLCSFSCSPRSSKHFFSSLLCPCPCVMFPAVEQRGKAWEVQPWERRSDWTLTSEQSMCWTHLGVLGATEVALQRHLPQHSVTCALLIPRSPFLIIACQERNPGWRILWRSLWPSWKTTCCVKRDNLMGE